MIFLDIRMPGKDGLELAKEIKQVRPLTNIIMVTAYQQYVYDAVKLYFRATHLSYFVLYYFYEGCSHLLN